MFNLCKIKLLLLIYLKYGDEHWIWYISLYGPLLYIKECKINVSVQTCIQINATQLIVIGYSWLMGKIYVNTFPILKIEDTISKYSNSLRNLELTVKSLLYYLETA